MSDAPTLEALLRFARSLALGMTRTSRQIRDPEDLAEDLALRAIAILEEKRRADPHAVPYPVAFVRRVVTNAYIDECRKRKRRARLLRERGQELSPSGAPAPDEGAGGAVAAGSQDCRAAYLAAVEAPGWANGRVQVDFAAVFLVLLRLALLKAARRARLDLDPEESIEVAQQTAPWPRRAHALTFYPGWPDLQTLWTVVAARYPESPGVIEAEGFAALVCSRQAPGCAPLTAAQWQQWCHRARLRARDLLRDDVWKECFELVFPPRTPRVAP